MVRTEDSRIRSGLFLVAAFWIMVACRPDAGTPHASREKKAKPVVYVVNYPLEYFTRRIGGDRVRVAFPVPGGEDPADWKPDTETVLAYQRADLIVLNGVGYAKWVGHASLPLGRMLNTSREFAERSIPIDGSITHSHGPAGAHEHAGTAFTTWLDPALAVLQARTIKEALERLRPDLRQVFETGFRELERDLLDLDRKLEELFSAKREQPLMVSHPVYQYFSRRYRLNVKSVHWEPDEMPTPEMWQEMSEVLAGHPAKWMLWERPPRTDVARKLRELGMESVVFSPCGNAPEKGDFLLVMRQNLENLKLVFGN